MKQAWRLSRLWSNDEILYQSPSVSLALTSSPILQSSRVSETNVAIQITIKKGMYIILDCEATVLRTLLRYRSQWRGCFWKPLRFTTWASSPIFQSSRMSETNVAIQIKIKKRNVYYSGLRSNRFADIASLSLAMTRLLLKASQAHNVSQLP